MTRILIIFFIIIVQNTNAQLNEHFNDIKATFKSDKQKELSIIAKKLNEVETKDADAQQFFLSGEISKGLNAYKKVSNIYSKNYRNLFLIYEEKLDTALSSLEEDKANFVIYILNKAKNSFRVSISERLQAMKKDDKKIAFNLLISAHKNEVDAINLQSKAFGVINGWINTDLKVKEETYTCDDVYDNTTTDNFQVKDFTENEVSAPGNYSFNKSAVAEEGYNTSIEESENSFSNTTKNNSENENLSYNSTNDNSYNNSETEFRIQIGVSILPASKSQIDKLNSTDLDVKTYKSKVYYKYTIGQFTSYQEAKSFKNAYGLKKTYITEYKNGKEVKFYYKDI